MKVVSWTVEAAEWSEGPDESTIAWATSYIWRTRLAQDGTLRHTFRAVHVGLTPHFLTCCTWLMR